ncbi:MAG TPA: 4-(cytidine 5'-diphospho)-2-C-methyl-D-erythritol kinase [Candidatus Polarisedimenticolia bacterium]|jgi:4-diphosphocytidyl-2-C-methyl-D-erythritol kinase|nr:4-(cytidine 5'-diphospho)-2-C-methyl-D-erythritol kinase [Candidatus Polarisedimenticolia bacterium]
MKNSVRLPAFAKINLRLHVLGRRADGYHELRTIFQAISLRDTLELSVGSRHGITLETNDKSLPAGPENLVVRAIEAFARETGFRSGIRVRLEKRIPVARGLGGGSSDAAAALIGMLRLTKRRLPLEQLMEIASGLGADVPFFLFGGRALAVSRGDEIYPLPDTPRRTILVVSPHDIAISTKDAYQWVSADLTKRAKPPNIWGFCALCWSRWGTVSNDFEEPVFRRHPRLGEIRDALLERGAAEAALAGSGSAVFGIFRNPAQARRAARKFPEDSVFVVETLSRGRYGRALGWSAAG